MAEKIEFDLKETATDLVSGFSTAIFNPILTVLVAVAFIYFFWGLAVFILNRDAADEKRKESISHMIWGIVGLLIIFSVWAIINVTIFGIVLFKSL